MSKIALPRESFSLLPEGRTILQIKYIEENRVKKQIIVTFISKEGTKAVQYYGCDPEKPNGLKAFGYLCHMALDDWDIEEIDTKELQDKFVDVNVVHNEVVSTKDPSKTHTYINFQDIKPAIDFDHRKLTDDELDELSDTDTADLSELEDELD